MTTIPREAAVNNDLLPADLKEDFEPFIGQTFMYDAGTLREVENP
jgi:hypothetical protein